MNWDWDKLQKQRRGGGGSFTPQGPSLDDLGEKFKKFRNIKFPAGKFLLLAVVALWLLSGIYIVEPDEAGVVLRFGKFDRITEAGPHYRLPFPVESVLTPKVTQIQRMEIGFRSTQGRSGTFQQGQMRIVPEESLMLTGDENIIDVQFIVQYRIKDPEQYLFNVSGQADTVKSAAEAAMREIIGDNLIDSALTSGKHEIQNDTRELLQQILDVYKAGIQVVAVQLQNVHPPKEVSDAFKDVASAREDKSRITNEAEAYRNDLLPKARGEAAQFVNQAEGYKQSVIRRAEGDAARFLSVLKEYDKAKDVTRERLYLETMEEILSNPDVEKILLSDKVAGKALPLLPLKGGSGLGADVLAAPARPAPSKGGMN
ncbi:MAG: FtsH protease activity modulator HflK [Desulfovibrionaceae bacterium]|jgi:membrane protease subunit HflK|nr:FtsH protease activity modulator HflK [Desulfovibrionaceae bacterium]